LSFLGLCAPDEDFDAPQVILEWPDEVEIYLWQHRLWMADDPNKRFLSSMAELLCLINMD
jgi:hypothetical protein